MVRMMPRGLFPLFSVSPLSRLVTAATRPRARTGPPCTQGPAKKRAHTAGGFFFFGSKLTIYK